MEARLHNGMLCDRVAPFSAIRSPCHDSVSHHQPQVPHAQGEAFNLSETRRHPGLDPERWACYAFRRETPQGQAAFPGHALVIPVLEAEHAEVTALCSPADLLSAEVPDTMAIGICPPGSKLGFCIFTLLPFCLATLTLPESLPVVTLMYKRPP